MIAGDMIVNVTGRIDGLEAAMKRGAASVQKFATKAGASLKRFSKNTQQEVAKSKTAMQSLKSVFTPGRMIAAGGLAAVAAGRHFMEFDTIMREVGVRTRATSEEFLQLTAAAQRLARESSLTSVEIGQMMVELGAGGIPVDEIEKLAEVTMKLSKGTRTEAAMTAKTLISVKNIWGKTADEAERTADVLVGVANRTLASVTDLSTGLGYAATDAAAAGMSFEETAVLLGMLADAGVDASRAGTGLRKILSKIKMDPEDMQAEFGIKVRGRNPIDIIRDIASESKKLGQDDKLAKFFEAFEIRGTSAINAVTSSIEKMGDVLVTVEQNNGELQKSFDKMEGGIAGAWGRLKSSILSASDIFVSKFAPTIITFFDWLASIINWTADKFSWLWDTTVQNLTTTFSVMAVYLGHFWDNMGRYAEIAMDKVTLFFVRFYETLKWQWTVQIPEFFVNTFTLIKNLAEDMGRNVSQILNNITQNIVNTGKSVGKMLTGDFSGPSLVSPLSGTEWDLGKGIEWTPRAMSDLEQSLENGIKAANEKNQTELPMKMENLVTALNSMTDSVSGFDPTRKADPKGGPLGPAQLGDFGKDDAGKAGGAGGAETLGITQIGTAAAMKTIWETRQRYQNRIWNKQEQLLKAIAQNTKVAPGDKQPDIVLKVSP